MTSKVQKVQPISLFNKVNKCYRSVHTSIFSKFWFSLKYELHVSHNIRSLNGFEQYLSCIQLFLRLTTVVAVFILLFNLEMLIFQKMKFKTKVLQKPKN